MKESKFEEAKKILRSSFPSVWVDDDSTSNENIVKIDPPSDPQAPISPNTTVNWKLLQSFPNLPIVLSK